MAGICFREGCKVQEQKSSEYAWNNVARGSRGLLTDLYPDSFLSFSRGIAYKDKSDVHTHTLHDLELSSCSLCYSLDIANSLLRESREAVANRMLEILRVKSAAQVKIISLTSKHVCPVYRPS